MTDSPRHAVARFSRVRVALVTAIALAAPLAVIVAPTAARASGVPASLVCSGYGACSRGSFTTHGYPQHASTSYWTMYPGNNCTNYVAYVESTVYGVATPTFDLGDGGAWAANAARNGVPVNHAPTVGAVAVWTGGSSGIPYPGHVAVVEYVDPQHRYIVISQQHMSDDADGYDWTRIYRDPSLNEWQEWPNFFVHFRGGPGPLVDGVHYGFSRVAEALDASGSRLATTGWRGERVWRIGLAKATSPSVTATPDGFELAFQTNGRRLATAGTDGDHRFGVTLRGGTSPSITAFRGGYEVAVQARSGRLVTLGRTGRSVWPYRLAKNTSPSITALLGGGFEVAFQSSRGTLVTVGTDGHRSWPGRLRPGSSPSITAIFAGGYEVAAQSRSGSLLTAGSTGTRHWRVHLRAGTSPSITPAFGGGVEVAFETPRGTVEAVGSLGLHRWDIRVERATSPSIAPIHGGGFEIVVHAADGRPVAVGTDGVRRWALALAPGTSPAVRP